MTERVAEVEQRALARLALVGRDDLGLDPAAFHDRVDQRLRLAREEARQIRLEPFEEARGRGSRRT